MPDRQSRAPGAAPVADAFRSDLLALLPHMRAFARGLCGRPEQADDLVQETVMRAWTARDSFTPGTSMKAWTFTIMRNHFLNDLRKNRRQTQLDPEVAETTLIARATQEEGVHINDLQRALDKLPDERREALLLVGAGGFSYEEAANICGVPIGTMKSRVARGRSQLYAILEPEEGSPAYSIA
ncbi:sigma-70 family RNA polymerase sigma factor [Novosphingobium sp.]|uniref:sigma-70 family RNA polymerase sigma factor n=1 Tax=Novosphingobium sp. TaxID=1874826 RepID=UPI0025F7C6C5|nr:sigma-70 family RNA polymerase sigma factor [Novosphingobium sp.]